MTVTLNEGLSKVHTQQENQPYNAGIDINLVRKPDRFIYIFTVSKRDFVIQRPPLFPLLNVPACAKDQVYRMVASIPDPFPQAVMNTENWRIRGEAHDGLRVAIDLINPNNITNNPDWVVPQKYAGAIATGEGCNLQQQGLFISLAPTPTDAEVQKALGAVKGYYEALRVQIDMLNADDARVAARMNVDYGMMADYFGLTYPWHTKNKAMVDCPNCGERMAQGTPWHVSALGPCINDWKKAVSSGIKKKDEVPDEILAKWEAESRSSGEKAKR